MQTMTLTLLSLCVAAVVMAASPSSTASAIPPHVIDRMEQTYQEHRALTQFYRWYLFYERDESDLNNQLDILAPHIHLKSSLGEGTGHEEYKRRVAQIPLVWENAHHIEDVKVSQNEGGTLSLEAHIVYHNLDEAKKLKSYRLHYTTSLVDTGTTLPQFEDINIQFVENVQAAQFEDAYPVNRMRSLVHYWLALIENNDGNAEPFREIFADSIQLDFSTRKLSSFAEFTEWFQWVPQQIAKSSHRVEQFNVTPVDTNIYEIEMEFEWEGVTVDQKLLEARTRHHWRVRDLPQDRFPKIETVKVTILKPFQPKPVD